jgi:hypothetical protein
MNTYRKLLVLLVSAFRGCLGFPLASVAAERPKDFRGVKWVTPVSKIPELQFDEQFNNFTYYTRATDLHVVMGLKVETVRYLAENEKIIGAVVKFSNDLNGLVSCEHAMKGLRNLYGLPDESNVKTIDGLGSKVLFSKEEHWFAQSNDEATVRISCPAKANSFHGYIELMSKARAKQKSGL